MSAWFPIPVIFTLLVLLAGTCFIAGHEVPGASVPCISECDFVKVLPTESFLVDSLSSKTISMKISSSARIQNKKTEDKEKVVKREITQEEANVSNIVLNPTSVDLTSSNSVSISETPITEANSETDDPTSSKTTSSESIKTDANLELILPSPVSSQPPLANISIEPSSKTVVNADVSSTTTIPEVSSNLTSDLLNIPLESSVVLPSSNSASSSSNSVPENNTGNNINGSEFSDPSLTGTSSHFNSPENIVTSETQTPLEGSSLNSEEISSSKGFDSSPSSLNPESSVISPPSKSSSSNENPLPESSTENGTDSKSEMSSSSIGTSSTPNLEINAISETQVPLEGSPSINNTISSSPELDSSTLLLNLGKSESSFITSSLNSSSSSENTVSIIATESYSDGELGVSGPPSVETSSSSNVTVNATYETQHTLESSSSDSAKISSSTGPDSSTTSINLTESSDVSLYLNQSSLSENPAPENSTENNFDSQVASFNPSTTESLIYSSTTEDTVTVVSEILTEVPSSVSRKIPSSTESSFSDSSTDPTESETHDFLQKLNGSNSSENPAFGSSTVNNFDIELESSSTSSTEALLYSSTTETIFTTKIDILPDVFSSVSSKIPSSTESDSSTSSINHSELEINSLSPSESTVLTVTPESYTDGESETSGSSTETSLYLNATVNIILETQSPLEDSLSKTNNIPSSTELYASTSSINSTEPSTYSSSTNLYSSSPSNNLVPDSIAKNNTDNEIRNYNETVPSSNATIDAVFVTQIPVDTTTTSTSNELPSSRGSLPGNEITGSTVTARNDFNDLTSNGTDSPMEKIIAEATQNIGIYIVLGCIVLFAALLSLIALIRWKRVLSEKRISRSDSEASSGTELQEITSLIPTSMTNGSKIINGKYPNEKHSKDTVNLLSPTEEKESNGIIIPLHEDSNLIDIAGNNNEHHSNSKQNGQNCNGMNNTSDNTGAKASVSDRGSQFFSDGSNPAIELTKVKVMMLPDSLPKTPIFLHNKNS